MNHKFADKFSCLFMSAALAITMTACSTSSEDGWQKVNQQLLEKHNLKANVLSGLPSNNIKSNLEAGIIQSSRDIDSLELYPGVSAKLSWGTGAMIAQLNLRPDAKISEETLPSDKFLFVLKGSVEQSVNGAALSLIAKERENPDGTHGGTPRTDFVFLEKGSKVSITAGTQGAQLLEVYSPLRLDYLQKAGVQNLPDNIADVEAKQTANVQPGKIYDLYDFQLAELGPGIYARMIMGKNMTLAFGSMDPDATVPVQAIAQEQLTLGLRGDFKASILDRVAVFRKGDVVRIPSNMVHEATIGKLGADVLTVYWPGSQELAEKEKARIEAFRVIIPEDAKPELLIDGKKTKPELIFTEGPKWLNGKVYFSNMYFDANFNADPKRSSIVELDPSGSYKNITEGKMQANGLYPLKNGNLLVCDMMGHRVVEMTTKGEVVRVVADKYDGKPVDGPNDVIADAKGGFYFTDPQFTMEAEKFQPGRAVYYVAATGKITRIVEPNEFAMPNGIVLSPNGKTLYINNCYDDEDWYPVKSEKDNYIWAYDVNEDGTISNGRQFAKLLLPGVVLDRRARSSSADGMAIDKAGNLYVATYLGVQIFNAQGQFVGIINLPTFPVSLCFGDDDMKTLYIVGFSYVWKIRTNMEGHLTFQ